MGYLLALSTLSQKWARKKASSDGPTKLTNESQHGKAIAQQMFIDT